MNNRILYIIKDMHVGDMTHSRVPFHRLKAVTESVHGMQFELFPSPTGYFIKCVAKDAPCNDDASDGQAA